MVRASSVELNDRQAVVVATKIAELCKTETFSVSVLCDFLAKYAKLQFSQTMELLNSLGISTPPSQFDTLRLAYALLHYDPEVFCYGKIPRVRATAKILRVTADTVNKRNPKITLHMLTVDSPLAGRLVSKELYLPEAVRLSKNVYSGRAKALQGRSLLELVGCVVKTKLFGSTVDSVFIEQKLRERNKQLCKDRAKADFECHEAPTCAHCKKRRCECRLAVRT